MNAKPNRFVTGLAFAVASGLLVAATSPASAVDPRPSGRAAVPDTISSQARSAPVKYCIIDLSIGNRIPQRMCKTRAQWAHEGISVDVQ